jgi:hypothetical protein
VSPGAGNSAITWASAKTRTPAAGLISTVTTAAWETIRMGNLANNQDAHVNSAATPRSAPGTKWRPATRTF